MVMVSWCGHWLSVVSRRSVLKKEVTLRLVLTLSTLSHQNQNVISAAAAMTMCTWSLPQENKRDMKWVFPPRIVCLAVDLILLTVSLFPNFIASGCKAFWTVSHLFLVPGIREAFCPSKYVR